MSERKVDEATLDRLFGPARPGWTVPRMSTSAEAAQELEAWACEQVGHSRDEGGRCIYCGDVET